MGRGAGSVVLIFLGGIVLLAALNGSLNNVWAAIWKPDAASNTGNQAQVLPGQGHQAVAATAGQVPVAVGLTPAEQESIYAAIQSAANGTPSTSSSNNVTGFAP